MSDTCCVIKKKDEAASLSARLKSDLSLKERKTVLFVAIDAIGHINSLIGIADCLKKRGHRTVFLFHDPIDNGLQASGHEVYDCTTEGLVLTDISKVYHGNKWDGLINLMDDMMKNEDIEKNSEWVKTGRTAMCQIVKQKDAIFARKLELIKPDVMILDQFFIQPAILKYGKPWALIYSPSPLGLHPQEHNLPHAFSGLPTKFLEVQDEQLKQKYCHMDERYRQAFHAVDCDWQKYLLEEHQINTKPQYIHKSPHLNIYLYPEELDYELPVEGWHNCDSILRINNKANIECNDDDDNEPSVVKRIFEIPAKLKDKPGKLIYLSMGTLASHNLNLMRRFVQILSKSPHRFIVSTGPRAGEYELAANMWGEKHVDQLAILPQIDMIITHGGNNTITECFYYGVPGFIVCPVFGDQKDNAQRIEECKLGKRVNPYECSDEQFLDAIEEILADESIKPRMKAISERMQKPESKYKALRLLTKFVEQT